jgi:hypothetical protein
MYCIYIHTHTHKYIYVYLKLQYMHISNSKLLGALSFLAPPESEQTTLTNTGQFLFLLLVLN